MIDRIDLFGHFRDIIHIALHHAVDGLELGILIADIVGNLLVDGNSILDYQRLLMMCLPMALTASAATPSSCVISCMPA